MLRIFAVVAVLACAVFGASCGSDDTTNTGGPTATGGAATGSTSESERYKIALITGLRGDPFYVGVECGAKEAAAKLGVDLDIQGPEKFDAALETQVVNSVAATKPDAIAIAPADPKALFNPLKQVVDDGVKLVLFDGTLLDTSIADSVILADNHGGGVAGGKAMLKLLDGEGKVLIVTDKPGNVIQQARVDGFKEAIEGSNVEVVGTEYGQGDTGAVTSKTAATIARVPDLSGIYTTGGVESEGVATALRQADMIGKIKFIAFGNGPTVLAQIDKGELQALISQKPREEGRLAIEAAVKALKGEPVEKDQLTGAVEVRKDNQNEPEVKASIAETDC